MLKLDAMAGTYGQHEFVPEVEVFWWLHLRFNMLQEVPRKDQEDLSEPSRRGGPNVSPDSQSALHRGTGLHLTSTLPEKHRATMLVAGKAAKNEPG